jgi:hypothetical protein
MKLTRADFRPRTKAGSFYTRRGGDVVKIDALSHHRPDLNKPVRPSDWWIEYTGTFVLAPADGPVTGAGHACGEMKLHEFYAAGWRRVQPHKLKPAWQAFFGLTPLDVAWSQHGG